MAIDRASGMELWRSDGTRTGTHLTRDIRAGRTDRAIFPLAETGGMLYFATNDGVHGEEPWLSDGMAAGTWMVKDINAPDPRTVCTDVGGTVQVRRATWVAPPRSVTRGLAAAGWPRMIQMTRWWPCASSLTAP